MTKEYAIVFSGSGALLYAHFGAAQCLYDAGVRPKLLVGTSGGAIAAAFLSAGREPKEGLELAKEIKPKDIISFNWSFWRKNHWGMFSLKKLEAVLEKHVPMKFCYSKIPLYVVVTDVSHQRTTILSVDDTPAFSVPLAVRASASVPFLFDCMPIAECRALFTDGGVTNNFAVDLNVVKNSKNVMGVRLLSEGEQEPKPPKNLKDFTVSVLGSMMSEIERRHIKDASIYAKTINIRLPWNSMDFFNVDEEVVKKLYDEGYKATGKKIDEGLLWEE